MENTTQDVYGFLNNMSFSRTLYQFEKNMEDGEYFNVKHILTDDFVGWTVDSQAKSGQLCFWMHTSDAITHINNIRNELNEKPTHPKYDYLMKCLDKAEVLYNRCGGKIFAIGRLIGEPQEEKNETRDYIHWTSKFYGPIYTFYRLNNPIPKEDFAEFAQVKQKGAITNLTKDQCLKLLSLIEEKENVIIPLEDDEMVKELYIDTLLDE